MATQRFQWNEYLVFAEEIINQDDHSAMRSAVSRAYYSLFCTIRNYLIQLGKQIPRGTAAHKEIPVLLKESSNRDWKSIGVTLESLRIVRNQADYDDDPPNFYANSALRVKQARRIFDLYKNLRDAGTQP